MAHPSTRELTQLARSAGYEITSIEQLRPNRWLLALTAPTGMTVLVLAQARPLIGAADVQDLAQVAQLRRTDLALLLALGGSFSPVAQMTLAEIGDSRLRLCTTLPPAPTPEPSAAPAIATAAKLSS